LKTNHITTKIFNAFVFILDIFHCQLN